MGWLSGFSFRKSHIINAASGAGTNYQVRVKAHYGSGIDSGEEVYLNSHCRTDFGDVRFTDDDGTTLLDYWMESKVDSDYAIFWVEVADDLSTNPATIYVYYGNPSATTTSNGDNTFIFFDDFLGASLNTDKWDANAGVGTITVADSMVRIQRSAGTGVNPAIKTKSPYIYTPLNRKWECKLKWATLPTGRQYGFNFRDNGGTERIMHHLGVSGTAADYYLNCDAGTVDFTYDFGDEAANTWYRLTSAHKTGKNVGTRNGVTATYTAKSFTDDYYHYILLGFYIYNYNDATSNTVDMYVDWVFIRKWVDPEPTHGAWGSEETIVIERFQEEGTDFRETKFGATWA
jgi:hypothetical protein